jgi:hypothetical protein
MSHSQLAERIGHLPQAYDASECSTATLIKQAGYLESPDGLDVEGMEEILHDEPGLIEDWLKRWGDQRIAGGWVMDCEGKAYRLKNFDSGKSFLIEEKEKAFAEFIVRYVRRIGRVIAKYEGAERQN